MSSGSVSERKPRTPEAEVKPGIAEAKREWYRNIKGSIADCGLMG